MSNTASKFGMLRSLNQATTENAKAEKQNSVIPEKQPKSQAIGQQDAEMQEKLTTPRTVVKVEKQNRTKTEKQNTVIEIEPVERYHYSSYMPAPLYARLQLYVAKKKAVRGKTGEKVSLQSVITEALEQYLEKHDR